MYLNSRPLSFLSCVLHLDFETERRHYAYTSYALNSLDGVALDRQPTQNEEVELKSNGCLEHVTRIEARQRQLQNCRQVLGQVRFRVHERPEHGSQNLQRSWSLGKRVYVCVEGEGRK